MSINKQRKNNEEYNPIFDFDCYNEKWIILPILYYLVCVKSNILYGVLFENV